MRRSVPSQNHIHATKYVSSKLLYRLIYIYYPVVASYYCFNIIVLFMLKNSFDSARDNQRIQKETHTKKEPGIKIDKFRTMDEIMMLFHCMPLIQ